MSVLTIEKPGKNGKIMNVSLKFKNATIIFNRDGTGKIEANSGKGLKHLIPVVPQTFDHVYGYRPSATPLWGMQWSPRYWENPQNHRGDDYHFHNEFWSNINPQLEFPLVDTYHGGIPLSFRRGNRAEMRHVLMLAVATSYLSDTTKKGYGYWGYPDISVSSGTYETGPQIVNRGFEADQTLSMLVQLIATEYYPVGRGNKMGDSQTDRVRLHSYQFRTGVSAADIKDWVPRQKMAARRELATWLRGIHRDPAEYISTWSDHDVIEMDEPAGTGAALGFDTRRETAVK